MPDTQRSLVASPGVGGGVAPVAAPTSALTVAALGTSAYARTLGRITR